MKPMVKSSRHAKITGDFGEALVLYWLSKQGFECARVDHTGIDIIATDPETKERMGISVKCRSRIPGTEGSEVSIPNDNFDKAKMACEAFGCVPYFGIVVEANGHVRGFLLTMKHLRKVCPSGKASAAWKMGKKHLARYASDKEIRTIEFFLPGDVA